MTQPTPDREREALFKWLDDQRAHVLGVLTGLSEESLRKPVELLDGRTWMGPDDTRIPRG